MTLISGFVVQGRNTYFMKLKMNIINVKKKHFHKHSQQI